MKILWLILTLIPAPFLFHFYEYGQHVKREEAPFLFLGSVIYIIIIGFLSGKIKIHNVIWVNVITGLSSILLAMYFIPDDSWFKPFGRDFAVIFVAVIFFIGQVLVRFFSKLFFGKK